MESVSPLPGSFEDLTFSKASAADDRVVNAPDGSGRQFSVSYDVQLTQKGVVSLDAVATAASVTCFTNGTVVVALSGSITHGSIEGMYPIGSVLVINNELFGECKLAEDVSPPNESENDAEIRKASQASLLRDSFLYIEKVTGSPTFSIIEGTPTSYFALFDNFHLEIFPVSVGSISNVSRQDVQTVERIDFEKTFSFGPIEVACTVGLDYNLDFLSFTADFGLTGMNLELKLRTSWTISISVEASLKGGRSTSKTFSFISQALVGLPSVDFFTRIIGIKIPPFKIGAYFEAPFIIRGGVELELPGKIETELMYKTAVTERTYFARGSYVNVDFGSEANIIESGDTGFQRPTFDFSDQTVFSGNVFLGLAPSISLYLPLIQARVGVEVGTTIKLDLSLTTPFPPESEAGLLSIGICDECHKMIVDAIFQADSPFAILILGADFTIRFFRFERPVRLRKVYRARADDSFQLKSDPFAKFCTYRDEDFTTCGEVCCENDREQCDGSGSEKKCVSSTSPTPTSSPTRTPCPECDGKTYTDPHLRTFDGLYYDCQAIGEFVMVKSTSKKLDIRALFIGRDTSGTVTKGVVVTWKNAPKVQVSVALTDTSMSSPISSCPVQMFVDGEYRDVLDGESLGKMVSVKVVERSVQIELSNGIKVSFSVYKSGSFGCYFEWLNFYIPIEFITGGNIVGLLGTPNRNPYDDWMKTDGTPIIISGSTDLIYEEAYNYCTDNWCINQQTDSLLTFSNGSTFSDFNQCNVPYGGRPDFSSASEALINLCGTDVACLIDGLAGDLSDAQNALEVQAEIENEVGTSSAFRFEPSSLEVGSTQNVLITLDVRQEPAASREGLTQFAVYKIDSTDGSIDGPVILTLDDGGQQSAGDNTAGDLIFSNILAIRSSTVGETFSYRAVPVFDAEDRSSQLTITRLNAIRIYSTQSGVGKRGDNGGQITVATLDGLQLVAHYTWPTDQRDLDTATQFLDEKVGYDCGSSSRNYTEFITGDDTSSGGTETIVMRIGDARSDGAWGRKTIISFAAGWYNGRGTGPATLSTVLRDQSTNGEIEGTALTVAIDPGSQNGCASQPVAQMVIIATNQVVLKLTKE